MSAQEIHPGLARQIDVSASGDVSVVGWAGPTIQLVADHDRGDVVVSESTDEPVVIRVDGDARLQVPRDLAVRVSQAGGDVRARDLAAGFDVADVHGDLRVEDVRGDVRFAQVHGDARIQRVIGDILGQEVHGDLEISQVDGSLSADRVDGDIRGERITQDVNLPGSLAADVSLASVGGAANLGTVAGDLELASCRAAHVQNVGGDLRLQDVREEAAIDNVGGDASLASCRGHVRLDNVGGDLTARDVTSGLVVPNIGGRLRLRTFFGAGCVYDLKSGGSATIALDGDLAQVSATFELRRMDGGRITTSVPLADAVQEPGVLRGRLGSGDATVRVTSHGNLRLGTENGGPRFDDLFEGIFEGMDEGLRSAFGAFATGRSADYDVWRADRTALKDQRAQERARRAAEEAERRAQELAQRVAEKAQRHAERAARHATRQTWQWRWPGQPPGQPGEWPMRPPPPPAPAPPPRSRSTEEERLAVLRMLAEGTITTDDAARLLEALGR